MKSPSFSTSTYITWTPEKRLYFEPFKQALLANPINFDVQNVRFRGKQTKSSPLSSPIIDAPGRPATAQVKLDCCAKCAAAKWPTQPSWKHRGTGHTSVESIQWGSIGLSSQAFLVPGETMKNVVLMLLASCASVKSLGDLVIEPKPEELVAIWCCNRDTISFPLLGRPSSFGFAHKFVWWTVEKKWKQWYYSRVDFSMVRSNKSPYCKQFCFKWHVTRWKKDDQWLVESQPYYAFSNYKIGKQTTRKISQQQSLNFPKTNSLSLKMDASFRESILYEINSCKYSPFRTRWMFQLGVLESRFFGTFSESQLYVSFNNDHNDHRTPPVSKFSKFPKFGHSQDL